MRMTRGRRAVLGGVVTGLLMLPLINLFAPLIGAAMATHLFHMKDIT
jgi:CysZ protein